MARVYLTDAAMCMTSNESWFNTVISYGIFNHCDFLLCKHNCITNAWPKIFGRGC